MSFAKEKKISSNRSFGIVFFIVFLLVALWPLKDGQELRYWSLIISIIFLILGVLNSKVLYPLNKLWNLLGVVLGNVVSPIVMGLIFFLVVTPTGIIMRLIGKDLLKLKKSDKINTYWIKRDKIKSSIKNQF